MYTIVELIAASRHGSSKAEGEVGEMGEVGTGVYTGVYKSMS
jgi:hypothetical protein